MPLKFWRNGQCPESLLWTPIILRDPSDIFALRMSILKTHRTMCNVSSWVNTCRGSRCLEYRGTPFWQPSQNVDHEKYELWPGHVDYIYRHSKSSTTRHKNRQSFSLLHVDDDIAQAHVNNLKPISNKITKQNKKGDKIHD